MNRAVKTISCFVVIALPMMFSATASAQDIMEAWAVRYNGTAQVIDLSRGIAIDADGFPVVVGETLTNLFTFDTDLATIRYTPAGEQDWIVKYDPNNDEDYAGAVTTDADGNIYVTGSTLNVDWDEDIVTLKYNSDGALQWAATYDGPGDGDDAPVGIAVDEDGNVYVGGVEYFDKGSSDSGDYLVLKYEPDGDEAWTANWNGAADEQDKVNAIGLDSDGYVYVTGFSGGGSSDDDWATVRFTPGGALDWAAIDDGPAGGMDDAWDLVVIEATGGDRVVVVGYQCETLDEDLSCADFDGVAVGYDFAGDEQWRQTVAGDVGGWDTLNAVVADADGNAFAAGGTVDGEDGPGRMVVVKYEFDGDEAWMSEYEAGVDAYAEALDLALDASGGVYALGLAFDVLTLEDITTVMFDAAGDFGWVKTWDGSANAEDFPVAIAVDDSGDVYVEGTTTSTGAAFFDFVTIKYTECAGCYIDGVCRDDGDTEPGNVCAICDPDESKVEWTDNDGVTCDDGLFCNGDDVCDGGTCSDHDGDPCGDDGEFCNGEESCNEAANECESDGDPCPDDGQYCNGGESCNETANECVSDGDPCADDGEFCNGDEICVEANDECAHTGDPCEDDGEFCNGVESCDETNDECESGGDPCADDGVFCNGAESCDEAADDCAHTGDPCEDDGEFCNGDEFCNETDGECGHSGDPCGKDEACAESSDECVPGVDDDAADDDGSDDDADDDGGGASGGDDDDGGACGC